QRWPIISAVCGLSRRTRLLHLNRSRTRQSPTRNARCRRTSRFVAGLQTKEGRLGSRTRTATIRSPNVAAGLIGAGMFLAQLDLWLRRVHLAPRFSKSHLAAVLRIGVQRFVQSAPCISWRRNHRNSIAVLVVAMRFTGLVL